jgi:general secretion pathway protein G
MQQTGTRRRCRRHVFTLIEIMIVIVIIGMITGLVGPAIMERLAKAKRETAKTQIVLLKNACKDYYLDLSEYPRSLDDLVSSPGNSKWDGPYLDPAKVPVDPWGQPYQYQSPGQHGDVDLSSFGNDKAPGGEGKNADITSWE